MCTDAFALSGSVKGNLATPLSNFVRKNKLLKSPH